MESYEALVGTLAMTMGVSWASGINLYAALLMLGLGAATGNIDLPPDLQILENPLVIGAAGLMYAAEFFADKIPGVDTGWDGIHTFVRIPAGAMLAAGTVGDVTPALEMASAIMGGSLAATSHVTKAGSRVLINTSPEPVSNWTASITEDVAVFGGLWTALNHPWIFLGLLLVFLLLVVWLLPKLLRAIAVVFRKLGEMLGLVEKRSAVTPASPPLAETGDERVDRLTQLKHLLDSGAITEEEFATEKQRLLSG